MREIKQQKRMCQNNYLRPIVRITMNSGFRHTAKRNPSKAYSELKSLPFREKQVKFYLKFILAFQGSQFQSQSAVPVFLLLPCALAWWFSNILRTMYIR